MASQEDLILRSVLAEIGEEVSEVTVQLKDARADARQVRQFRRLREARGFVVAEAAHDIQSSSSKIRRLESAWFRAREADVAGLLTVYRMVDQGERGSILELTVKVNSAS
jgi:hypothetical protein